MLCFWPSKRLSFRRYYFETHFISVKKSNLSVTMNFTKLVTFKLVLLLCLFQSISEMAPTSSFQWLKTLGNRRERERERERERARKNRPMRRANEEKYTFFGLFWTLGNHSRAPLGLSVVSTPLSFLMGLFIFVGASGALSGSQSHSYSHQAKVPHTIPHAI